MLVQLALGDCGLAGLDVDLTVLNGCWDVGFLPELGLVVGVVEGRAFLVLVDLLRGLPFLKESFDFEVWFSLEIVAFFGRVVLALLCIQSCVGLLFLDDDIFPFFVFGLEVEPLLDD